MIVICELQCKGISHEEVNSGFIYGLRLAYPNEKIIFFADKNYFRNLKNIFKVSGVIINDLILSPINFSGNKSYSLGGVIKNYLLIKDMFDKLISFHENKVFFLSMNPVILYLVKKLKQQDKYKEINCTFVLHGELEDIANKNYKEAYIPGIRRGMIKTDYKKSVIKGFRDPKLVLSFAINRVTVPIRWLDLNYSLIFKKIFRVKKMMMWQHSNQYKYISLSPHVTKNASKYLNTKFLNFHTIILPIIFNNSASAVKNKFIKFAVFGYGDSAQMYRMLTLLSKKKLTRSYEIRIISMDSRGTEGFANITWLSRGRVLSRREMEDSARDIDVFINLYDRNRHRFGCSLSIFESFSYLKPVLHLSNPGYDYFNKQTKPIGFRCENMESFVRKMVDMIENFPEYKSKLAVFKKNMLEYRKEYNIKNNLTALRDSFTFEN
ncbi:MAG: hypothetical protein ABSE04_00030 [Candidatus Microgenomates bacterium]|jgi:hypothetical protein